MRTETRRDEGFALVMVLWALLVLGVVAANALREARTTKAAAAAEEASLQSRLILDGAINRSIVALINPQDPLRIRLDGQRQTLRILDRDVELRAQSETGKIDLNAASESQLAQLFRAAGEAQDAADVLAGEVATWRAALPGPARQDVLRRYRDAGYTFGPRFGSFRSPAELHLLIGMTEAIANAVEPCTTIWSNTGMVDYGVADDTTLALLAAGGDALAASQRQARKDGEAAGGDRSIGLGEVVTITVQLKSASSVSRRRAVVQFAGDPRHPYRVFAWQ